MAVGILGLVLLVGCIAPLETAKALPPNVKPKLIQHPGAYIEFQPTYLTDAIDCLSNSKSNPPDCSNDFNEIQCDNIRTPDLWWGESNLRWIWCQADGDSFSDEEYNAYVADGYIVDRGVQMFVPTRLILVGNDGITYIKNHVELRDAFIPINSPAKAMSFAIAQTGFAAIPFRNLPQDSSLGPVIYFVHEIEGSYVRQVDSSYEVLLYDSPSVCTPWQTFAVWVRVHPDGEIEEIERTLVFQTLGGCA